jgi:deazaflavin-dependent oxidoreductase (nitroreductase family)
VHVGDRIRDLRLLATVCLVADAVDVDRATKPAFRSWRWRAGNAIVSVLARVGIGPIQLLTTRDRRTGGPHTIPVVPVEQGGKWWLVAPYGPVSWVRNAREDGRVRVRYGRTTHDYTVREVTADEAGPVLKRYLAVATKTRAQFGATEDSPVADFAAESDRHPVFELVAIPAAASTGGNLPRDP